MRSLVWVSGKNSSYRIESIPDDLRRNQWKPVANALSRGFFKGFRPRRLGHDGLKGGKVFAGLFEQGGVFGFQLRPCRLEELACAADGGLCNVFNGPAAVDCAQVERQGLSRFAQCLRNIHFRDFPRELLQRIAVCGWRWLGDALAGKPHHFSHLPATSVQGHAVLGAPFLAAAGNPIH